MQNHTRISSAVPARKPRNHKTNNTYKPSSLDQSTQINNTDSVAHMSQAPARSRSTTNKSPFNTNGVPCTVLPRTRATLVDTFCRTNSTMVKTPTASASPEKILLPSLDTQDRACHLSIRVCNRWSLFMPHHSQCEPSSPLQKDDTGLSIGNCTSSIFLNTFALSKARARLIMCMSRVGRHLEVFYVANIPTCEFACSFLILNLLSFSPSLPPLLFAFYIVVAAQSSPSPSAGTGREKPVG